MKLLKKMQAYTYVKTAQITAPGHYDAFECRGCGESIKACKTGLCKACQSIDRQYRRDNHMPIEHQAFLIREHREGRL